jgi:hypothetical protein
MLIRLLAVAAATVCGSHAGAARGRGVDVGTHTQRNRDSRVSWTEATERSGYGSRRMRAGGGQLRIGVVLPRQIFQQRRYQAIMAKSLSEVLMEPVALGGNASAVPMVQLVREAYDFAWTQSSFRLDDPNDSINFGDLEVSPPPSGECALDARLVYLLHEKTHVTQGMGILH